MASDSSAGVRSGGKRISELGFQWVSSSPAPAVVARLEDSFPEVVQIPVAELEAEVVGWQNTAILARSYHKWIPAEALIREFRRAGIPGEIVPLSLAYRCHILRFDSPEARDKVLQRPWVVNGQVVGTEAWRAEFVPADDSIPSALVWVRMPNLPLEFWKDSFIRAILEPAGAFLCTDDATKLKNRGGFARACLRVDLRCPLRPGVRVQGINQPFWQQFIYENLEGVCMRCGSLHLGSPCLLPESSEESVAGSDLGFGPWLVAVRQRKTGPSPHRAVKGWDQSKSSLPSSGSSPVPAKVKSVPHSPDDWISPRKTARRRPSSASKGSPGPSMLRSQSGKAVVESEVGMEGVPVVHGVPGVPGENGRAGTVPSEHSQQEAEMGEVLVYPTATLNPFAVLASAAGVEAHLGGKVVAAAPLKRARSEVSVPPRSVSKLDRRKGKGKVRFSKSVDGLCCGSLQANLAPYGQVGPQFMMLSQPEGGEGSSLKTGDSDAKGLDPGSLSSKMTVQSDEPSDGSVGQRASLSSMSDVDTFTGGGMADSVMLEDQCGVQVSPNL